MIAFLTLSSWDDFVSFFHLCFRDVCFLGIADKNQNWLNVVIIKSHQFDFNFILPLKGLRKPEFFAKPLTIAKGEDILSSFSYYFIYCFIINGFV